MQSLKNRRVNRSDKVAPVFASFALVFCALVCVAVCVLTCVTGAKQVAYANTIAVMSETNSSTLLEVTDIIECEVHSTGDVVAYAQDDPKERYSIKNISSNGSTPCSTQLYKVTVGELSNFSTYPNVTITIDNTVVAKYENRKYKQGSQYTLKPNETVYPRIHIDNWTSLSDSDRAKIKNNPADLFNIKYFATSNNSDATLERVCGLTASETNYEAFKQYQNMCKSDNTLKPVNELIIAAGAGSAEYIDNASYANFYGAVSIAAADEASGNYKTFIVPSFNVGDESAPGYGSPEYVQLLKENNSSSNKQIKKVVIVGGTWEDRSKIKDNVKAYMSSDGDIVIPEPSYANKNASSRTVYAYQYISDTYKTMDKDTAILVSDNLGNENSDMINASICVASYAINNNIPVFAYDDSGVFDTAMFKYLSGYRNVVLVGDPIATYKDGGTLTVGSKSASGTKLVEKLLKNWDSSNKPNVEYIKGSDQGAISLNYAKWALSRNTEIKQTLNYCSCTNNSAGKWMDLGSSTSLIASKYGIQLGGFKGYVDGQTTASTIPESIKSFISSNLQSIGHMYIFGGIYTVSSNIESELKSILRGGAAAALASADNSEIATVGQYNNSITIPWAYPLRCVASNGNPLLTQEYQMDEYVKCYTSSDTRKENPIYCSIKWNYDSVTKKMYFPARSGEQEFDLTGTIVPPTSTISFKSGVSDKITVHVKVQAKS